MLERILNLLPFHIRKHYIDPIRYRFKDKKSYNRQYDATDFFDKFHSLSEANDDDRATISPDFPGLDAQFHYNAVENQIIDYIKKNRTDVGKVMDIGSGTGHWVHFYDTVIDAGSVYATDISAVAIRKLNQRFKDNPKINVYTADVDNPDYMKDQSFSIINAIGVIFHIVSDEKWEDTIKWCYSKLQPGGLLIVSGLFGVISANVQFEPVDFSTVNQYRGSEGSQRACNKRVRSRKYWKKILKKVGFQKISFKRTNIPSHISAPENNLVFAVK